jgi:hypothetical protein
MIDIINEYLNRKSINKKIEITVTSDTYNSLIPLIIFHGNDVFKRNKSPLSTRTINDTIPIMINNLIENILVNLEEIKTVKRNSFEHYFLLYGDNAKEIYEKRTNLSLQTKENFINRHGLEKGCELWEEYSIKKSNQNTLNGFIERYGITEGTEKFNKFKQKLKFKNTLEYHIKTYGEDMGNKIYSERYPSEYDLNEFTDYKKLVYKMSNIQYNNNMEEINPNRHKRTRMGVEDGWQLDHIIPVSECFKQGMSVEEASDISNLRMLPWKDNLMRNFKK